MMLTLAELAVMEAVDMLQALIMRLACTAPVQPFTEVQVSEPMVLRQRRCSLIYL